MAQGVADQENKLRDRLLSALELMELGIALTRQNIARQLPGASPETLEREFRRWMFEQPAEFKVQAGDADGTK